MDYVKIEQIGKDIIIQGIKDFCLDDILDRGQCFRWEKLEDGCWRGVVSKYARTVRQTGDTLTIFGAGMDEFNQIWYNYFDFGRDYGMVKEILSQDTAMRRAMEFTPGMRVLRQEPWEALCSFILSQNNNIKRIRGLVMRLCESFGEKIEGGFAFPAPEALAGLSVDDMSPVRSGFRAKYVIDAAKKVSSGEIDLQGLYEMELEEASRILQEIRGVGPKVAACALLYGFGRADSIPRDVWINRAINRFYPNGIPESILSVIGLGQQYLFHYARNNAAELEFSTQR